MTRPRDRLVVERLAVWRVERDEQSLSARFLHDAEASMAERLGVGKRRIEFVAGRVAAKRALIGLGLERLPITVAVLPEVGERSGAPIATDGAGNRLPVALSISHADGWAAAAAAWRGRVGLDLQTIVKRDPRFNEEAFTDGELGVWGRALDAAPEDPRVITVAWCAKEALLKVVGLGLRASLHSYGVTGLSWLDGAAGSGKDELRWAAADALLVGECRIGLQLDRDLAIVVAWKIGDDPPCDPMDNPLT